MIPRGSVRETTVSCCPCMFHQSLNVPRGSVKSGQIILHSYPPFFLPSISCRTRLGFVICGFNIPHNGTLPNCSFHLLADTLVLKDCTDLRLNIANVRFLLIKVFLSSSSFRCFPYSESFDLFLFSSLQIGLNFTDILCGAEAGECKNSFYKLRDSIWFRLCIYPS